MPDQLSPVYIPILEKAAVDNGFDLGGAREGVWLSFESSQTPLRIWLTTHPGSQFVVAFSRHNVAFELVDHGVQAAGMLPPGALAARSVVDHAALHRLIRRAFQLSRTLPDELLHVFEAATAGLPQTTEVERLVVRRVGQDIFRKGLIDYWESRCAITGLAVIELLRASHIKPWADCAIDAERLDVFNGFLLAPNLDAAFDNGFITISDDGAVIVSTTLDAEDRRLLDLEKPLRIRALSNSHLAYLSWHRERVFKASP